MRVPRSTNLFCYCISKHFLCEFDEKRFLCGPVAKLTTKSMYTPYKYYK